MPERSLISVFDGETLLDQRELRLLILPEGQKGAVWRGLAYPCSDGGRIQIEGPAFTPAECREAKAATNECVQWKVVEGQESSYVLVAGSVIDAERIADQLRGASIEVQRVGRYLGDPIDGYIGDWFVRVGLGVQSGARSSISAALGGLEQTETEPQESIAEQRVRLLSRELAIARAEREHLRNELLQKQVELAEAKGVAASEVSELRRELEEEQKRRSELETEKVIEESPAPRIFLSQPSKIQEEIETAIQSLLPRIELVRDTLNFISAELITRSHLYRALAELNASSERMPANWKKLRGVTNCWERHVSTGQDDAGRIYANFDADTLRWLILVSHKGDQNRDINWIDRNW